MPDLSPLIAKEKYTLPKKVAATQIAKYSSTQNLRAAVTDSHKWPMVLDEIAAMVGCSHAYIFKSVGQSVLAGTCNGAAKTFLSDLINSKDQLHSSPACDASSSPLPTGFIDDLTLVPLEQITPPDYLALLNAHDMQCGALATFPLDDKLQLVLGVNRSQSGGPLQPSELIGLDRLLPDLQKELPLANAVAECTIASLGRGALNALDLIGVPAAVLGPTSALTSANKQFEALGPTLFVNDPVRLKAHDRKFDSRLLSALNMVSTSREDDGAFFFMPAHETSAARICHIATLKGTQNSPFTGQHFLVTVHSMEPSGTFAPSVLASLFRLTPAESRITFAIVSGQTVDEIAATSGVSRETVRTQVKTIMNKTGMKRQIELVRNLSLSVPQFPKGRFIPD